MYHWVTQYDKLVRFFICFKIFWFKINQNELYLSMFVLLFIRASRSKYLFSCIHIEINWKHKLRLLYVVKEEVFQSLVTFPWDFRKFLRKSTSTTFETKWSCFIRRLKTRIFIDEKMGTSQNRLTRNKIVLTSPFNWSKEQKINNNKSDFCLNWAIERQILLFWKTNSASQGKSQATPKPENWD